jgi:single-stranded-DNA-specific exonuclease
MLRGQGWPAGVIGLVAARIADEYRRPAIVVDVGDDACRGSGRSVEGFDLVTALTSCADLLIEFGGHSLAAGFAVEPQHLDALEDRLMAATVLQQLEGPRPIAADCMLSESELDWTLHRALVPLGPFGAGNPPPVFAASGLRLVEARTVGTDGKHLRARLRVGAQVLTAFGPDLGRHACALAAPRSVAALFSLETSAWNGLESLELRLQAIHPSE